MLYFAVKDLVPAVIARGAMPLPALMRLVADTAVSLMRYAAAAGLVMAAADYVVARRRIDSRPS